jgi:hypothetical protein
VTVRMRGQDKEEDERSEGSVGMTMRQLIAIIFLGYLTITAQFVKASVSIHHIILAALRTVQNTVQAE